MAIDIYTPSADSLIHKTEVDFSKRMVQHQVNVVQYDKNLPIVEVKLYLNGDRYILPENSTVSVRWSKKDRTFTYKDVLGCSSERDTVYFDVDEQMTYFWGNLNPVLEVSTTGDDGFKKASSQSIPVVVDRNPIQDGDLESAYEIFHIEDVAAEVIEKADQSIILAQSVVNRADSGEFSALTVNQEMTYNGSNGRESPQGMLQWMTANAFNRPPKVNDISMTHVVGTATMLGRSWIATVRIEQVDAAGQAQLMVIANVETTGEKGDSGQVLEIMDGRYYDPDNPPPGGVEPGHIPIPAFSETSEGTAYVVDDSESATTLDLWMHNTGGTTWNIIDDWGGIPGPKGEQGLTGAVGAVGPTGLIALESTAKISSNVVPSLGPKGGSTPLMYFNRTPVVGDRYLTIYEGLAPIRGRSWVVTMRITDVNDSGCYSYLESWIETTGPSGADGYSIRTYKLNTSSAAQSGLLLSNVEPNNGVKVGDSILCTNSYLHPITAVGSTTFDIGPSVVRYNWVLKSGDTMVGRLTVPEILIGGMTYIQDNTDTGANITLESPQLTGTKYTVGNNGPLYITVNDTDAGTTNIAFEINQSSITNLMNKRDIKLRLDGSDYAAIEFRSNYANKFTIGTGGYTGDINKFFIGRTSDNGSITSTPFLIDQNNNSFFSGSIFERSQRVYSPNNLQKSHAIKFRAEAGGLEIYGCAVIPGYTDEEIPLAGLYQFLQEKSFTYNSGYWYPASGHAENQYLTNVIVGLRENPNSQAVDVRIVQYQSGQPTGSSIVQIYDVIDTII